MALILLVYAVLHLPAFFLLAIGLKRRRENKSSWKIPVILATIYFIVGGGICATLINGNF